MNNEVQSKINQLSMMEQNIQNFSLQKQQFQAQLLEIESAEKELESAKESFKIVGNIMVSVDKESLKKELSDKKEVLQIRVDSFEKQEDKLKEKAEALQKEVLDEMKNAERQE